MGLLMDAGTVEAERHGFSTVTPGLRWRHEPDAAVTGPVVAPVHESHHPGTGLFHAAE